MRCYIFLEKGHISNNCTMNYSSNICRGKYSISLRWQNSENSESKANKNNDNKNDVNVNNLPTDNSSTIFSTTAVNRSTESNNVLLQTAFAKTTNEKGCHFEKVRILFDLGSQRSYSDEHIRKKLEVLVMSLICRLNANQHNLTVSKSFPHLRHLKLAVPCVENTHVFLYLGFVKLIRELLILETTFVCFFFYSNLSKKK